MQPKHSNSIESGYIHIVQHKAKINAYHLYAFQPVVCLLRASKWMINMADTDQGMLCLGSWNDRITGVKDAIILISGSTYTLDASYALKMVCELLER